ncbi:MAG: tRNA (adenosine(37)-N6)-threonylcarbamoyltransferase complex transferase subunit TsaD [Candidatus Pacebacteria bacterium]|nr:tRNA (adenosine(37)-N6)-threonylcarbamoyltransferase complex transferase subunit TsaD [Candidatus Paceibacterota bacterium]
MKILAIETSCDETGISILKAKKTPKSLNFEVLANTLASQVEIHKEYGGVYPALAKREHIKNLPILLEKALKQLGGEATKLKKPVDLITVTSGPGLEPALWTGIVFAKELSAKWNVPIIPANHMEGHILSVFADIKENFKIPLENKNMLPMLSLLISGGHTELVLVKDFGKYKIIGETVDDAVGEAYDKVARMLELPYPGGPEISRLAEERRKSILKSLGSRDGDGQRKFEASNFRAFKNTFSSFPIKLPRPMIYTKDFNFSFSGLKTAVLYLIRDLKKANIKIDENIKRAIALEFENAVTETLVHKTKKAIEKYKIKSLIVAGGVSANKNIKKEILKMTEGYGVETKFPTLKLTGDNSLMIALAGYLKYSKNPEKKYNNIKAEGNLRLK